MAGRYSLLTSLAAGALSCTSAPASHAVSPVTDEGVLCRLSYVFVGHVIAFAYHDNRQDFDYSIRTRQLVDSGGSAFTSPFTSRRC